MDYKTMKLSERQAVIDLKEKLDELIIYDSERIYTRDE